MKLQPADSLGYQVNLLGRLLANALRQEIAELGVVPGQFPALLNLYQEDGLTQAELTRRVGIEQPTMANTLARMERDGLITRAPDPKDKRRTIVRLSAKAKRLESKLAAAGHAVNRRATEGLSEPELEQLMRAIGHLIANLEKET